MALRAVVCTIAFGEATRRLARLMAASLRAGGWRHPIVVLTDSDAGWPPALEMSVRVVPRTTLNLEAGAAFRGAEIDVRDYPEPSDPGPAVKALTPIVHRWLDMDRHDLALILDADILATGDLAAGLPALADHAAAFGVGLNVGSIRGTPASHAHLTRWERRRWRRAPCLNTGFVWFRPERQAMAILKAWEVEMLRRLAGDQAALQAIYLRRFRGEIAVMDHDWQTFAPMPRLWDGDVESLPVPASRLLHFRGAIRAPQMMLAYAHRHLPAAAALAGETDAP